MLVDPLELTTPLGGFNGGLIVDESLETLHELTIKAELVGAIIEDLTSIGLSVWVYQGTDWFVLDLNAPHVEREANAVQFQPTKLDNFDAVRGDVVKIVGVSDEPELIARPTRCSTSATPRMSRRPRRRATTST